MYIIFILFCSIIKKLYKGFMQTFSFVHRSILLGKHKGEKIYTVPQRTKHKAHSYAADKLKGRKLIYLWGDMMDWTICEEGFFRNDMDDYLGNVCRATLCKQSRVPRGKPFLLSEARFSVCFRLLQSLVHRGFRGFFKGKGSILMRERHENLKHKYGNKNFWCRG